MCVATSNLPEHQQPELRYGVEKSAASPYIQLRFLLSGFLEEQDMLIL